MTVEPLFGAGFESFWLGRAGREALAHLLVAPEAGAQRLPRGVPEPGMGGRRPDRPARRLGVPECQPSRSAGIQRPARLGLAFLVVALAYNLTEAAFKMMHPVWIAFLLAVAVPADARPLAR